MGVGGMVVGVVEVVVISMGEVVVVVEEVVEVGQWKERRDGRVKDAHAGEVKVGLHEEEGEGEKEEEEEEAEEEEEEEATEMRQTRVLNVLPPMPTLRRYETLLFLDLRHLP